MRPIEPKALWRSVSAEQAATLPPHDLAGPLLAHLLMVPGLVTWHDLTHADAWQDDAFRARAAEIGRNVSEALGWMLVHGLLMHAPGHHPFGWFVLTRRAQALVEQGGFSDFLEAARVAEDALHPAIRADALPALLRGEHDTAVLVGAKRLEVSVREAAGLPAALIGQKLVDAAFRDDGGPLRNPADVEPSERLGERFLFLGAILGLRNAVGHRDPKHDAATAYRALVFFSLLLSIVDARRSAKGS